jgi:hypothetical protein
VLVYRSAQEPDHTLKPMDTLDAEKVVPGFDLDTTFFKSLRFQESNIRENKCERNRVNHYKDRKTSLSIIAVAYVTCYYSSARVKASVLTIPKNIVLWNT